MASGSETSSRRNRASGDPYRGPDRRRAPRPTRGLRAFRPAAVIGALGALWIATGLVIGAADTTGTAAVVGSRLDVAAAALGLVAGGTCILRWHLEGTARCWWAGWALLAFGTAEMVVSAPDISGEAAAVTTFGAVTIATAFVAIALWTPAVNTRLSWTRTLLVGAGAFACAFVSGVAVVTAGAERVLPLASAAAAIGVAIAIVWFRREELDAVWLVPFLVSLGLAQAIAFFVDGGFGLMGEGVFEFVALAVAAVGSISSVTVTAAEHRSEALHADIERGEADERLHTIEEEFRARMHELRSSVSALAGGVRGLEQSESVSAPLTAALEAELERLRGLVTTKTLAGSDGLLTRFVVDTVVQPTLEVCAAAGWPVSWELEPDELAYGRPADVAQIVHGLVANARRHAPGSPIEVRTAVDGEHVLVRVDDRGPGVPRNQRELVFEPGVTSDRTGEGDGLGLAISRRLAREMLAELWVEPRAGGGASFVLALRRADPDDRAGHPDSPRLRVAR